MNKSVPQSVPPEPTTRIKSKSHPAALEHALSASSMAAREWTLGDGRIQWSGGVSRLYDLPVDVPPPTSHAAWLELIHPSDRERVATTMHEVTRSGGRFEIEFRLARGHKFRWIRETGEVITEDNHLGQSLVAIDVDVTASRANADELRRVKLKAESASLAKTQFLANMSHEFRTPIGAILGFADLLGEMDESDARRHDFKRRIKKNGDQLLRMIDDVLDLSKAEAGQLQLQQSVVSLVDLFEDVRESLSESARTNDVTMAFAVEGSVPAHIVTDGHRLRQILVNIIGNAIKFSSSGSVTTHTTYFASDTLSANGAKHGHLQFSIRDHGVGIGTDQVHSLFAPFSPGDASTTRRYGGTGLGLSLARRLARLLGGDVTLHHTGPDGSEFTVTCSCTVVEDHERIYTLETKLEGHQPSPRPLEGLNLLVVDDATDNRLLIGRILEMSGAAVSYASNGTEGVRKGREKDINAILMDIHMPEMDGYQATAQLRGEGIAKPIVAITAHALSDERERCLKAGCSGYLTKPVNRINLINTIRHLLPKSDILH